MNVNDAVLERYSEGAQKRVEALCCPVDYDRDLLNLLPDEIIERDYGCGDPSAYVQDGDTVLDLGSGSGKICYMAAQLVGDQGKIIGIDMNNDMLDLARSYQDEMASKLGSNRVEFLKGQIQDLALDVTAMETWLKKNPVSDSESLAALDSWQRHQKANNPLVLNNSVDLVISNCVLNLVSDEQKRQMVEEIFRVVKPGGRIAISDIISDQPIPAHLKEDEDLWSGCISGAFEELEMLEVFKQAGFHAVAYDKWSAEPWQVVEGIEFRSVTITAIKHSAEIPMDKGHAVIYKGPFSHIKDDANNEYPRGERMAVSDQTFEVLMQAPYAEHFIGLPPGEAFKPAPWSKPPGTKRPAGENKGANHVGESSGSCC